VPATPASNPDIAKQVLHAPADRLQRLLILLYRNLLLVEPPDLKDIHAVTPDPLGILGDTHERQIRRNIRSRVDCQMPHDLPANALRQIINRLITPVN